MARLDIQLLGCFRVTLDGELVTTFESDKTRALLAYLAVEADRPHRREALVGLLWPDWPEASARQNLSQTLYRLRQAIGDRVAAPPFLLIAPKTVQFNQASDHTLDVAALDALPAGASAQLLEQAVAAYQGPFLAGFSLGDSAAFETWLITGREHLHRQVLDAIYGLVSRCLTAGEYRPALGHARRGVEIEPTWEAGHRLIMQALALSGQRSEALAQYEACRQLLKAGLGVTPSTETDALLRQIRSEQIAPVPGNAARAAHSTRIELPVQLTSFVGRRTELAEIGRSLANPDCRLLSLVGPGGIGKTRIAIQAAAELAGSYADGVRFVPLAPVSSPEGMAPAIASAMDSGVLGRAGASPRQQVLDYLREKQMLVVLDNLEALVDQAPLLSDILRQAPRVKLLVTSRQRLYLQSEWVYVIDGMRFPGSGQVSALADYDAVELFLQRARQADTRFAPSDKDLRSVVRICQLVGGMPLVLELAASWIRTLTPAEIAGEIEHGPGALDVSMRDAPQRHQGLSALFDSAWNRLLGEEQRVLRRLAVFRGGFERAIAQQVAGASLPLLYALVDHSLVRQKGAGHYEIHEAIRQFAETRLAQDLQEAIQTRQAHCVAYGAFLQMCLPGMQGGGRQKETLHAVSAAIENIRAGWQWAQSQGDLAELNRYVDPLMLYYWMHGVQEGTELVMSARQTLQCLLETGDLPVEGELLLAKLLAWQGRSMMSAAQFPAGEALVARAIAMAEGRQGSADWAWIGLFAARAYGDVVFTDQDLVKSCLGCFQSDGDHWGMTQCMIAMSGMAWARKDWNQSALILQQALDIALEAGNDYGAAEILDALARLASERGEFETAVSHWQEALIWFERVGGLVESRMCMDHLGHHLRRLGDYDQAEQLHQQALAISRELGFEQGIAGAIDNLGMVAFDQGRYENARVYLERALELRRNLGEPTTVAISQMHLAELLEAVEDYRPAARHITTALNTFQRAEIPIWDLRDQLLSIQGGVYLAQGDLASARQCHTQALEHLRESQRMASAMNTLARVAELLAAEGDVLQAICLAALVLGHRSSDVPAKKRAERLLAELGARVAQDELEQALAAGSRRDWIVAVDEILDRWALTPASH